MSKVIIGVVGGYPSRRLLDAIIGANYSKEELEGSLKGFKPSEVSLKDTKYIGKKVK